MTYGTPEAFKVASVVSCAPADKALDDTGYRAGVTIFFTPAAFAASIAALW